MNLMSSRLFGELVRSDEPGFERRIDYLEWYEDVRNNFDDFLKQPLELWMFVPCNEDGNVLEEPKEYKEYVNSRLLDAFNNIKELGKCAFFQQAKERCLFEGFEYNSETEQLKKGRLFLFFSANFCEAYLDGDTKYLEFIEEIADYDIQLTQTAIKQIGCDH